MKTFKSVLIIIVGLALVAAVLGTFGKRDLGVKDVVKKPVEIDLAPVIDAKQLCYIWNTERGDKAMLSMDIRGENVIGEFYWLPAEKDKKTGIFKGTFSPMNQDTFGGTFDTLWDTNGEGMKVTEEFKIIVDGSIAHPGFGEMKDRGDGVYIYADPNKVDYSLNLQQTDCGDDAMD
jgi:hypothetical protein